MIVETGQRWHEVGTDWDLPRLKALSRHLGKLPPLAVMVGRYLGYSIDVEAPELTPEEHAARLIGGLTGM